MGNCLSCCSNNLRLTFKINMQYLFMRIFSSRCHRRVSGICDDESKEIKKILNPNSLNDNSSNTDNNIVSEKVDDNHFFPEVFSLRLIVRSTISTALNCNQFYLNM